MKIAGRTIGPDFPPYIIAEVGCNHGGSLERALAHVNAAKQAGADAVKFQAYEAGTITIAHDSPDFKITEGPWAGQDLFDLYTRCQTPFDWFPKIATFARKIGITWFASVFDKSSVLMLDKLDVAAIKIASFEIVDLPLIKYAASTYRPMIISTGMADWAEINAAAKAMISAGSFPTNAAWLHCVSGYPTPPGEADLNRLNDMRMMLGPQATIGLSDHTTGIEVPIAATALGATVIEKHFTVSRTRPTPDATFSLEPGEFRRMVIAVRATWAAMQATKSPSEASSRPLRRSLYCVDDIAAGETFTADNVRSIRPGYGLPPAEIDKVLGKTAARDLSRGTALAWEMIAPQ